MRNSTPAITQSPTGIELSRETDRAENAITKVRTVIVLLAISASLSGCALNPFWEDNIWGTRNTKSATDRPSDAGKPSGTSRESPSTAPGRDTPSEPRRY
jgi:hypothetical protein